MAQPPAPSNPPLSTLSGASTPLASPFSDGAHTVGSDVEPGTYRAPGGDGCYWARVSGFDGTPNEVIASGNPTSQAVVNIRPTDTGFETSGCGTWTPDLFGFGG